VPTPSSTKIWPEQNLLFNDRATDHPENENCLTIYTQNVHGLRAKNEENIKCFNTVDGSDIHQCLHGTRDSPIDCVFISAIPKVHLMIYNGLTLQLCQGAKGGVAIILG